MTPMQGTTLKPLSVNRNKLVSVIESGKGSRDISRKEFVFPSRDAHRAHLCQYPQVYERCSQALQALLQRIQ